MNLRAVSWFAGTMLCKVGKEAGKVVVEGLRGHSITLPNGANSDSVRGVMGSMLMGLDGIEVAIMCSSTCNTA